MTAHIHILGIGGTFMGGVAALAREAGVRVTGCDANLYPPMSDQLVALGIESIEGYDAGQLALQPDLWVVGNVVKRGNPLMEAILERGDRYVSGPQWLAEHILHGKWVLAVAGTHGKTTTSAMLAWILEASGRAPGFLIGGAPANFELSARAGGGELFVIEADEYDTAFFDKRSKFVHYRARTAILNNLEFDHADIFDDLASIERQFHHFVRILPSQGLLVVNAGEPALRRVLDKGCWTPVELFGSDAGWHAERRSDGAMEVFFAGRALGIVPMELHGEHNRMNALAAIAAARHAGVSPQQAIDALATFGGVRRRMELRGEPGGIQIYDDFAHHPTAIHTTLAGLRERDNGGRVVVALELRSNTMRLGATRGELASALASADRVHVFARPVAWDVASAFSKLGSKVSTYSDTAPLLEALVGESAPGDRIVVMSNGGFDGLHGRLLERLTQRAARAEARAAALR